MLVTQGCSKPIADGDKSDDDEKGEKDVDSDGERPVGNGKGEGNLCPEIGAR